MLRYRLSQLLNQELYALFIGLNRVNALFLGFTWWFGNLVKAGIGSAAVLAALIFAIHG